MTITLDPQVELRLLEKAHRDGQDPNALVNDALLSFLTTGEDEASSTDLRAHGISHEQAAELRARLMPFAEDWEQPEMDVYDNYDAAKSGR
jgi:hypothetical protein